MRVPRAPAAAFSTAPAKDPAYALGTPEVDPLQQMLVESLKARRDFINASVSSLKLDEGVLERGDEWAKQKIALEKQFGIANKFQEMEAAFKYVRDILGIPWHKARPQGAVQTAECNHCKHSSNHGRPLAVAV